MQLYDVGMRINLVMLSLVCDECRQVTEHARMTNDTYKDKVINGHVCQGCVDDTLAMRARLHN